MRRILLPIASASLILALTAAGLRAQSDVDKSYKKNCVLCHSVDGSGSSPTGKSMKAKDLKSPEVQKMSDAELADFISQGKGKMPAFSKKLKPEEIQQLVAYVRALAKK
jgi:mono/diheme cytochrome c family protein